ncbi:unnamed protein product [Ceratitis capitata]|uniref:(Mediterranean fruit fly) hypothetical protein n=1 Tax=Ceratitis capitata TaxID=7213 RepID=A0A811UY94_CERCA|nr:unnamed protein product [Ceratitis capitata]
MKIGLTINMTRPFSYGPEGLSSVSTRYINRQLELACDCKQKIVQFLNYLKTKISTILNFASRQILITSVPSAATAAAQRFFIIMPRKLQHFKDNFGGIVIGCLNGFVVVPQRSVGNEDGASTATVAAADGGDAALIGCSRSSPTSCLSRIASTLQRLAAFACGTLLRFTRSCADLHSWRCLVANCRQLSCNILTCYNSNYSNSNMHHYYRGLVAYSHETANWLNLRVRNVSDLLATNIFCFFHYLQRILPSKPEYTSYTTRYHSVACCDNNSICNCANKNNNSNNNNSLCTQQTHTCCSCNGSNNNLPASATEASAAQQQQIRRHTIISTTLSNYNQQLALAPRRASIAWEKPTATAAATTPTLTQQSSAASTHAPPPTSAVATVNHIYKPVKITLIGEPLKQWQWNAVGNGKTITESNGNGKCELSNGDKNRKNVSNSSSSNGSSVNGGGGGSDGRNEGICNGHSNGVGKAVSNGYTNGNSSKANGCNGITSVGVVGNGKPKTVSSEPNQNHDFSNNWQQQQTHVELSNKNAYIQQHQQQQKPLQVYQPTNGSSNGNFNPTVTIV